MRRASNGQFQQSLTLVERFWQKVNRSGECWLWQGARDKDGYGFFKVHPKMMKAHRIAYVLTYGAIPSGLFICHRCDNAPCCRPDHLFLGTHKDNQLDSAVKGRRSGSYNHRAKIPPEALTRIRTNGEDANKLAKEFGVTRGCIDHLRRGFTWNHSIWQ